MSNVVTSVSIKIPHRSSGVEPAEWVNKEPL